MEQSELVRFQIGDDYIRKHKSLHLCNVLRIAAFSNTSISVEQYVIWVRNSALTSDIFNFLRWSCVNAASNHALATA